MQRQGADLTPSQSNETQDLLLSTLSRATGWLNPFNILRSGASKVLAASTVLMSTAEAADDGYRYLCFQLQGKPYFVDCILKSIANSVGIKMNETCQGFARVSCADASFAGEFHQAASFGSTPFGMTVCNINVLDTVQSIDPCLSDSLKAVAYDQYGGIGDIMITVGITAGGLLTAFGLYKAARCIYDSSSYRYSRDAHKKYDPLTQALAENDAALLVEIEKLGKGVELPQELMCMILEKHHTKKNFVVNGKPAPGIRFFDTEARKDARAAALQAAWNQIKSERATARNNARLLDDDSDSERFGLNENDILLVNMQK